MGCNSGDGCAVVLALDSFRAHKHGHFVGSKMFPAVARAPGHSCCGSLRTKYWWLK